MGKNSITPKKCWWERKYYHLFPLVFGWDKGIFVEVKDRPSSILNCGKYFKVDFMSYKISNCRNFNFLMQYLD